MSEKQQHSSSLENEIEEDDGSEDTEKRLAVKKPVPPSNEATPLVVPTPVYGAVPAKIEPEQHPLSVENAQDTDDNISGTATDIIDMIPSSPEKHDAELPEETPYQDIPVKSELAAKENGSVPAQEEDSSDPPLAQDDVVHERVEVLVEEQNTREIITIVVDAQQSELAEEDEAMNTPGERLHSLAPIVETPRPHVLEEDVEEEEIADAALISIDTSVPVTPRPAQLETRPAQRRRPYTWRTLLTSALLVLLVSNLILLWLDVTATHLYINALNPGNGSVLRQQDVGSYQGSIALTAPVHLQSTAFIGVHTDETQGTQQVLALAGSNANWHIANQFSAPLLHGTLTVTPDGHLVVESANTMQVLTAGGHLLWQLQSDQPARGVHHFQPVSSDKFVYTVKSVKLSQVGAYNLLDGTSHWTQTLDDTIDYAPPLLLDKDTLYVAGDHKIYALNSGDGSLRWEKEYVARTLLMENEGQMRLLLAAGAQGLMALNPDTGIPTWSFTGRSSSRPICAQLYQAIIGSTSSSNGDVVYTTGIVWQLPQIQEQVWLYAIDASTGTMRWSQQVTSNFTGADAGRTFTPLLDAMHATVVLQQQADKDTQRVLAFDANNGTPLWTRVIERATRGAPTLLQTPDGTLLQFTAISDSVTIFHTPSAFRASLLLLIILSALGLLLLLLLPFQAGIQRLQRAMYRVPHALLYPLTQFTRLWHFSRGVFILVLLVLVVGVSTLGYVWLHQPQESVYQVTARTGTTEWQYRAITPIQVAGIDAEGSITTSDVGDNLHQLQARNPDGTIRWKTFESEGTFSLPVAASQPGTLLVALSGQSAHASHSYEFASGDPAYFQQIDNLLILSLLNRSTGELLWQNIVVYPDEQQRAAVLGADANFIYVASTQTNAAPGSTGSTTQLFAVHQTTGAIDWRVFGPSEPGSGFHDDGKLFLRNGQVIWQIAGTVYAIDTAVGQITWRRTLAGDDPSILLQEEDQMAEATGGTTGASNVLLIARRDGVHALDPDSGNELWMLANPGSGIMQSPAGVATVSQTVLVYGNGQLQAFDVTSQRPLWSQKQLGSIQRLKVSDDGRLMYVVLVSSLEVGTHSPAVAAVDVQTGAVRWTFEPSGQAAFAHVRSDGFQSRHGLLFTTVCFPSGDIPCARERLYALNATTGATVWMAEGNSISDISLNQDSLVFTVTSSSWVDIAARLR